MNPDFEYKTSDLPLAAAMMFFGYILTKVQPINEKKQEFIFDYRTASYEPEAIKVNFLSRNLTVDAMTYSDNIKQLKKALHESSSKSSDQ